jgi:hypothetical protein
LDDPDTLPQPTGPALLFSLFPPSFGSFVFLPSGNPTSVPFSGFTQETSSL